MISLLFTLALAAGTVYGFVHDGVTGLSVLSACIVVLFTVAIVGVIRQPPRQ
jgi:hypothetical protein